MKKRLFLGVAVLAIATVAALNVNLSVKSSNLSDVSLANIEALAQQENAGILTILPGRINIKAQTGFYHHATSDGVDIVTSGSTTVLDSGSDLIWGAFYQLQPKNPGIFSLTSGSSGSWSPCFTVRANGKTGIFNPNPSVALEVGSASSMQQVKVNGVVVLGSDERMKENINDLSGSLDMVNLLHPVSYRLKETPQTQTIPEKMLKGLDNETITKMQADMEKQAKVDKPLLKRDIYGFLAQDLQKVCPNLVYENEDTGLLSVDYIGIIPILVNAIKEQQNQIETLLSEMTILKDGFNSGASLRSAANETGTTGMIDPAVDQCKLYQNIPNPFKQNTQIKYYIPESVRIAQLCIYNLQGTQIKQIMITQRGEGSQWISGSELSAGIYLYALVVDGKEVETKRMVLTK